MAVLVEGISVVIKLEAVLREIGEFETFKSQFVPNETLCADSELIRVGFMVPDDVQAYCEELERNGLVYLQDGFATDLTVCDQVRGFQAPTNWAECGTVAWNRDETKKIKACRLVGSEIKQVVTPLGWVWEDSLSSSFGMVRDGEMGHSLRLVTSQDNMEEWRSPITDRPLFVGRAQLGRSSTLDERFSLAVIARWLAVLPVAAFAAIAVLFPLHIVLYQTLTGSGIVVPYPELPERLIGPAISSFTFIWIGSRIAPTQKFKAAIALLLIFLLFVGVSLYFAITGTEIGETTYFLQHGGFPLVGATLAAIFAMLVVRHDSRKD